jgi:hypothetical protein
MTPSISGAAETLVELAARCEAATGPDRLLDDDIMYATQNIIVDNPAAYTASLDAAMTLVPEGCGWLGTDTAAEKWAQIVRNGQLDDGSPIIQGMNTAKGSTIALALTAAALRAHGEVNRSKPNDD